MIFDTNGFCACKPSSSNLLGANQKKLPSFALAFKKSMFPSNFTQQTCRLKPDRDGKQGYGCHQRRQVGSLLYPDAGNRQRDVSFVGNWGFSN